MYLLLPNSIKQILFLFFMITFVKIVIKYKSENISLFI